MIHVQIICSILVAYVVYCTIMFILHQLYVKDT